MSNSLWPHEVQHVRFPCPSLSPWICSKLISIESVIQCNYLILCCPLLLLPSKFHSSRVFSNESTLHIRWPNYWCFSFSTSPSNKYSEFISFRIDLFDLVAFQGPLKSLLQHNISKIRFFGAQPSLWSNSHINTWLLKKKNKKKKTALTIWTFVFFNEGDAKTFLGFPWWLRQLRICLEFRRPSFSPWLGKVPWKIKWLQTPVFLPRGFHFQRSLTG